MITFFSNWTGIAAPAAVAATTSDQAAAASPIASVTWGACGVSDNDAKIIRTVSGVAGYRNIYLKCGGPKFSDSPTWGYRHIKRYHQSQFETLAARSTYQNWRDVADAGLVASLVRTEVRGPEQDGKRCFSGTIALYDSNGKLYKRQIIRTVFKVSDVTIITEYPAGSHCETRRD